MFNKCNTSVLTPSFPHSCVQKYLDRIFSYVVCLAVIFPRINIWIISIQLLFYKKQNLAAYSGGGLVAKSCPTLSVPWIVACQAPLSMGFPRQEY